MSARKVLLLYVGPGYKGTDVYTANDITKIVNCGATDYLFLNPYEINNAKANDQILRAEWVLSESNIPNSVFDTTATSEQIKQIRQAMVERIDKIEKLESSTTRNYTAYVDSAVTLAKLIRAQKSNAKFWFGFPPYLDGCTPAAIRYNYYYYDYIFNAVKSKMTSAGYWSNVEGFYFGQEDIVAWYTRFNTANVNTQFDNVVVQNMNYLSDNIHSASKKFMWIPFFRNDYRATRFGYVINKTNIFDVAFIQPNYYFDQAQTWIDAVDSCVQSQAFKNGNTVIGGSKTSVTGPEMEVDENVLNSSAYKSRFTSYVNKFGKYITGSGVSQRPVAFYVGTASAFRDNIVYNVVKQFFSNGTMYHF